MINLFSSKEVNNNIILYKMKQMCFEYLCMRGMQVFVSIIINLTDP